MPSSIPTGTSRISLAASLPATSPRLFPYTTLFRSETPAERAIRVFDQPDDAENGSGIDRTAVGFVVEAHVAAGDRNIQRSEEHTSELQSHSDLVCRLLLEKNKYPPFESSCGLLIKR